MLGETCQNKNNKRHTRIHERSRSHSKSSLPPPELNKRRSESIGTASSSKSSGCRITNARESTLDG